MNKYLAGIIAGVIATAVLSALMLMKEAMGLMPELNVIAMLSTMLGVSLAAAWMVHFAIGAAWGLAFAATDTLWPGAAWWLRGVVFGLFAWLLMMLIVMPMAGKGIFGMSMGIMAPIMTAMLHVVFGAILGGIYGRAAREAEFLIAR